MRDENDETTDPQAPEPERTEAVGSEEPTHGKRPGMILSLIHI